MKRAAIAIGVNKTGDLPVLRAAVKNAKDFAAWATLQHFDTVTTITDTIPAIPVTTDLIKAAIRTIVDDRTYSQLILYFAGHGILTAPNTEFWLLSNAREDPDEAVNVAASINAARRVGIPHVAFISDACRSRPAKDWQTALYGSVVFPTKTPPPKSPAVDRFYATRPGESAREVEVDAAARSYDGLFTKCLLRGLNAEVTSVVEEWPDPPPPLHVVPAWKLADYLEAELPKFASAISLTLSQFPDAQIESRRDKYLAKITTIRSGAGEFTRMFQAGQPGSLGPPSPEVRPGNPGPGEFTRMFGNPTGPAPPPLPDRVSAPPEPAPAPDSHPMSVVFPLPIESIRSTNFLAAFELGQDVESVLNSDGRVSIEVRTGFTVSGIPILRAAITNSACDVFEENSENGPNQVRLQDNERGMNASESALIQFANGIGVCLAVLPGYMGTVVFRNNQVLSVNYTPSQGTEAFEQFAADKSSVERRRAFAAASMQRGEYRLQPTSAGQLAEYLRKLKLLDPTLGLYAAYAYAQIGDLEQVRSVLTYVRRDQVPILFDIALLSEQLDDPSLNTTPACPLLTQGWALLGDHRAKLPRALQEAGRHLIPGLWTTFTPPAMEKLFTALTLKDWHS